MSYYEKLREYVYALTDHWLVKQKYTYHGQRRAKTLKEDLTKVGNAETDATNQAAISGILSSFFRYGTRLPDSANNFFRCGPSGIKPTSLRGMLIHYITPKFIGQKMETKPERQIQDEIIANERVVNEPLLQTKIDLTRFLNKYIADRAHLWSRHGVNRAYELTDLVNNCQTPAELNGIILKFLQTGEIGSDHSALNICRPSGTTPTSLRGELVSFYLMEAAERKQYLMSPRLAAQTPKPAVVPLAAEAAAAVEAAAKAALAAKDKKRDQILQDLDRQPLLEIAKKLGITSFIEPEPAQTWGCWPSFTNFLRWS